MTTGCKSNIVLADLKQNEKKTLIGQKKKKRSSISFIGVEILSSAFLLFQSKFNQNLLFTFTVSECFSCYLAYVSNLWRVSVRNCILTQCISNYCILVFFCVYYCKIIRISARLVPKKKKNYYVLKYISLVEQWALTNFLSDQPLSVSISYDA